MRYLSLTGVLVSVSINVGFVRCTDHCRSLIAKPFDLCDFEGQWFLTMVTSNNPNTKIKDCSGYFGKAFDNKYAILDTFGRPNGNPRLFAYPSGDPGKEGALFIHPTPNHCIERLSLKAAVVDDKFTCFYACGHHTRNDYAQCFMTTEYPTQADLREAQSKLEAFGLRFPMSSMKLVDRDGCEDKMVPGSGPYDPRCAVKWGSNGQIGSYMI